MNQTTLCESILETLAKLDLFADNDHSSDDQPTSQLAPPRLEVNGDLSDNEASLGNLEQTNSQPIPGRQSGHNTYGTQNIGGNARVINGNIYLQQPMLSMPDLRYLQDAVKQSQMTRQKQSLAALKQDLGIDDSNIKYNIGLCSESVRKWSTVKRSRRSQTLRSPYMSSKAFHDLPCLQDWLHPDASPSMLVLGGRTVSKSIPHGFAWFSPATIQFAHDLNDSPDHDLVFFCGHPMTHEHSSERSSFVDLLMSIVFQTIQHRPRFLNDLAPLQTSKMLRSTCTRRWIAGDVDGLAAEAGKIIRSASENSPVYMVLDRLDRVLEAESRAKDVINCLGAITAVARNVRMLATWSIGDEGNALESFLDECPYNIAHDLHVDSSFF